MKLSDPADPAEPGRVLLLRLWRERAGWRRGMKVRARVREAPPSVRVAEAFADERGDSVWSRRGFPGSESRGMAASVGRSGSPPGAPLALFRIAFGSQSSSPRPALRPRGFGRRFTTVPEGRPRNLPTTSEGRAGAPPGVRTAEGASNGTKTRPPGAGPRSAAAGSSRRRARGDRGIHPPDVNGPCLGEGRQEAGSVEPSAGSGSGDRRGRAGRPRVRRDDRGRAVSVRAIGPGTRGLEKL